MKIISIFFLAMAVSLATFGQSKSVVEFEEKSEGSKLFLYQSVLRVMNKDKNPDFNMLIRNLDHLRFVSSGAEDKNPKQTFLKLDKGVQAEGFEEIMSFDDADRKCHVYELESNGGQSTWVVTLFSDGIAGALEMKGSLDLKYIKAISSLNMEEMQDLLPVGGKDSNQEERKPQN